MDFDTVIRKRASIRKYCDKKIKIDPIIDAIEAANLAPSPGNLSLVKYLIIEDKEKINSIAKACQQAFVKDAQIVVIICSNPSLAKTMYDERSDIYLKHHVGAVVENFLLKITDLGLASCWVGAFSDLVIKNMSNIPDEIDVEAVLPVGYKHNLSPEKQKKKADIFNVIYFDTWKNKEQVKETKISRKSL